MNKISILNIAVSVFFVMVRVVQAQTTLSGDHIITGNVNVGTSGTTGDIYVTGTATVEKGLVLSGSNLSSKLKIVDTVNTNGALSLLRLQRRINGGDNDSISIDFGAEWTGNVGYPYRMASITALERTGGCGDLIFNTRPYSTSAGEEVYERMRITSFGYVGIGSNDPSSKLEVNGDIRIPNSTNRILFEDDCWTIGRENDPDGAQIGTDASLVIRIYNSPTEAFLLKNIDDEPLFEVGGTGVVRIAKRQGDILMGEFGNSE